MITDFQCNVVFLSSLLQNRAPNTCASLVAALHRHGVACHFLNETNDVWCRDFMPVQVEKDVFCGFDYAPDYLHETEDLLATRTDGNNVCRALGFQVRQPAVHLKIDGGNVIRCADKIIMVEKVFAENSAVPRHELAKAIEEHFGAELVVLPWDKQEIYGHADGLVRYVGDDRVLLTNYDRYNKGFTRRVVDVLQRHFREVARLEYDVPKQQKHNWAYINWLQTDRLLLIPAFGYPEDEQAFAQITAFMPQYRGRAEPINATDLIRHEGCLNCASWTIYRKMQQ